MTGILAESLGDALRSLGHAVESTSGERQERGDLLALADRVGQALTGRGVTQNEPVHVIIGNRASDLVLCSASGRLGQSWCRFMPLPLDRPSSECNAHHARGFQLKATGLRSLVMCRRPIASFYATLHW